MQQQLEAVYTECVKAKVPNPFVLLSEVAQACGVCQKYNGTSVYCLCLDVLHCATSGVESITDYNGFSTILSLCSHPEIDTVIVIATRALQSLEMS